MQSPNRSLTMSMAKQIFYHNLKKGNKTEVKIFERDIKPYLTKAEADIYEKEIKPYLIKGEYQEWTKFAQFKWWHYNVPNKYKKTKVAE